MTAGIRSACEPEGATRRVEEWFALMELSHQLLMAGIRMRMKPGEDERELYRQWYRQQLLEHDRTIEQMAIRFTEALSRHAPTSRTANT
jgi:hypothetical protein